MTEAVNGGNLRLWQQVELLGPLRIVGRFFTEAFMEALTHFRGGGAGKCHDEHTVEGKSLPKKIHDSFDQHGGFSRSRRGANQQRRVSCLNRSPLLFCPLGHAPTPSLVCGYCTANGRDCEEVCRGRGRFSERSASPPAPSLPKSGWRLRWALLLTWSRLRVGVRSPIGWVVSTAADRAAADIYVNVLFCIASSPKCFM